MIRIYLDDYYIDAGESKSSVSIESDELNIKSISYHHDANSYNVMCIVDGDDAEKLSAFMLPPCELSTLISELPKSEIISVTNELSSRGIKTSGSTTAGELIDNICKFFNTDFKSLGAITKRDFS